MMKLLTARPSGSNLRALIKLMSARQNMHLNETGEAQSMRVWTTLVEVEKRPWPIRVLRAAKKILPVLALQLSANAAMAQAPSPSNPADYVRTTTFTYNPDGTIASTTVEPTIATSCYVTSYSYDPISGRISSVSKANCASASGDSIFAARTTASTYAAQSMTLAANGVNQTVSVVAGILQDTSTDGLGHRTTLQSDPRFGAVLQSTDSNGVSVSNAVDDLGRVVRTVHPDGTIDLISYCLLKNGQLDTTQSSNSAACPTSYASNEVPADAAMLVFTIPMDVTGAVQIASYSKSYSDRLGRLIRRVTQSFDGPNQAAGKQAALIVSDTVYSNTGVKAMVTQPYFLVSGSSTAAGSNDVGVTEFIYDALGRVTQQYEADNDGQSTSTFGGAVFGFGSYGSRPAALTSTSYVGMVETTTNDLSQQKIKVLAANYQTLRIEDPTHAQLAYLYDGFGNLIETVDALQNTTTMSYDWRGHRLQLNDPDKGIVINSYDALGEQVSVQSAAQRVASVPNRTVMMYDALGRLISRTEPEGVTAWYYDRTAAGAVCALNSASSDELLCEVSVSNQVDRKYTYDSSERLIATRLDNGSTQSFSSPSFVFGLAYDPATGYVSSQTYPSGLQVAYNYTSLGYLNSIAMGASSSATIASLPGTQAQTSGALSPSQVLWQANVANAWGMLESEQDGSGVVTQRTFEAPTGRMTQITAGQAGSTTVQNLSTTWDSLGNLLTRTDANGDGTSGQSSSGAVNESFGYDPLLNRLSSYTVVAPGIPGFIRTVDLRYNALGMLLYKSDVGDYSYPTQGGVQPHALQSLNGATYGYDASGNLVSAGSGKYAALTYTSFDRIASAAGAVGNASYQWNYDEAHVRIKETRISNGNVRTTWYLNPGASGSLYFEYETDSEAAPNTASARHYLTAWGRTIGVLASATSMPGLASGQLQPTVTPSIALNKVEYWHADHLGSLVATTDENGAVTQRYAYDPFGKRRYAAGADDVGGSLVFDWDPNVNNGTARGFTGHEELDDVGIVNMNGRIYDPNLALFMQADHQVPFQDDLQSYNRYAYARNNPLNHTDPTGFADDGNTQVIDRVTITGDRPFILMVENAQITSLLTTMFYGNNSPTPTAPMGSNSSPGPVSQWKQKSEACPANTVCVYGTRSKSHTVASVAAAVLTMRPPAPPIPWSTIFQPLARTFGPLALRAGMVVTLALTPSSLADDSCNNGACGVKKSDTAAQDSGEEEKPSLLDPKGEKHILDGDGNGSGGHRAGTGESGKSEFPPGWSDDKIKGEVSDIATDPDTQWSKPDKRGYVTGTGTRDGVDIKVVVDTVNGRIVTAYPTNLPRNP